jgi:hypothetical protein
MMPNMDVPYCTSEIRKAIVEMNDRLNNGAYVRWGVKQDLYLLKFMLDDVLENAPTFGKEEETWVKEKSQERMMQVLTK